jgi:CheY-like chemotaxis protein
MTNEGRVVKILDVNDDTCWSNFFKEHMEKFGCRVATAADGDEGVLAALRELPDLIMMNYLMGRTDGIEATRLLRAYPHMRSVPIILYSARNDESLWTEALMAGCNEFLPIPFGFEAVRRLVKVYCGAHIGLPAWP